MWVIVGITRKHNVSLPQKGIIINHVTEVNKQHKLWLHKTIIYFEQYKNPLKGQVFKTDVMIVIKNYLSVTPSGLMFTLHKDVLFHCDKSAIVSLLQVFILSFCWMFLYLFCHCQYFACFQDPQHSDIH
jgi:hypothetical protein